MNARLALVGLLVLAVVLAGPVGCRSNKRPVTTGQQPVAAAPTQP